MKKKETDRIRMISLGTIQTVAGTLVYALSVRLFLLPSGVITGGATGIAISISHFTGLPVSWLILLLNTGFLFWGLLELGRHFAARTVISSLLYPGALAIFERVIPGTPSSDLLLNTVFAGLGIGFSIGIVMRGGASTGGMDIPPLVLEKHFSFPVSVSVYVLDCLILLFQCFYNTAEIILYGILLLIIYTLVLDKVLLAGTSRTQIMIISRKQEAVRGMIFREFDRGVTVLYGEGGFTGEPSRVLLCISGNREFPKIERRIREEDRECFITATRVSEVTGRGFTLRKKYLKREDCGKTVSGIMS